MNSNLLTTKLYTPTPRQNFISRVPILERLDQALTHKLTLVAAPPGYGKTTLLSIWVRERDIPVSWLSLDSEDNDPSLFFQYLIAALQTIYPQVGLGTLSQLKSPQLPSKKAFLSSLINDLDQIENNFAIILDDYHWIEDQRIHSSLSYLIDHLPEKLHLIIASRSDPPLQLSRLRARNQLLEFRQSDLRMTPEEASDFIEESMGLSLSKEQVAALEARTEGWIAGLQLAALSVKGKEDIDEFIETFGGSHRYVIDYLGDEVFSQQPIEIQTFLTQIAILDRVCAPLCDEITGREDSKNIIHYLEEINLFLIALDDQRQWYRFHHLFLDYLRTALEGSDQVALHKKASQWFLSNQLYAEAVNHARAAGDIPALTEAISKAAPRFFEQGAVSSLSNWLNSLPKDILLHNSQLATYQGFLTFFSESPEKAEPFAEAAQEYLPPEANSSHQGQLMSLQAHLALCHDDLDRSVHLSRDALEYLDENDLFFRNLTLNVLGQVLEMKGDVGSASEIYQQAFEFGEKAGDQLGLLVILTNLVFSLNEMGQRNQALAFCQKLAADKKWHSLGGLDLADGIYLPWSLLSYEANKLQLAREQVECALRGVDRVSIAQGKLWGQYILARIHLANHEYESMEQVTAKGRQLARRIGSQEIHYAWFETLEAQANLERGEITAVERWAATKRFFPGEEPHHWYEHQYFTFTRLLIAQERWIDSETLLKSMEKKAEQDRRNRKLITIYLLQATLAAARSQQENALNFLQRALTLAEPQDYRRAFLDEGQVILGLLPEVRHVAPAFVDRLLLELPSEMTPSPPTASLYEPLSERELEVLYLVARGYSNRQIAEALFVTLGTVKKHLNNIFGKLQVANRTQAVAKAREIGLLN